MNSTTQSKLRAVLYPSLAVALFLLIWWAFAAVIDNGFLLPTPIETGAALLALLGKSNTWLSILLSILRVLLGYFIGIVLGIALALLMPLCELSRTAVSLALTVIKSTPVVSFILLIWVFSPESILPAVISALIVLPIVTQNVYSGIANIDQKQRELLRVFDVRRLDALRLCYIPEVYPHFASAAITSLGMAWKASVAAEVLAYVRLSIGKEMFLSKSSLRTEELFAYTIIVIVLSLIIEKGIKLLFGRVDAYVGK